MIFSSFFLNFKVPLVEFADGSRAGAGGLVPPKRRGELGVRGEVCGIFDFPPPQKKHEFFEENDDDNSSFELFAQRYVMSENYIIELNLNILN
jgi:hypothetical protein